MLEVTQARDLPCRFLELQSSVSKLEALDAGSRLEGLEGQMQYDRTIHLNRHRNQHPAEINLPKKKS